LPVSDPDRAITDSISAPRPRNMTGLTMWMSSKKWRVQGFVVAELERDRGTSQLREARPPHHDHEAALHRGVIR
jgi:hypothetical protein